MTNYDSFEHASDWLQEAKRHIEPNISVFMLVGTKHDKEHLREVPIEQAQQFADYHNLSFMETSSKTGHNVEETFLQISRQIYEMLEEGKIKMQDGWDGIKSGYTNRNNNNNNPLNLNDVLSGNNTNTGTITASSSDDFNEQNKNKKSCC
jgi:hypothetical protein